MLSHCVVPMVASAVRVGGRHTVERAPRRSYDYLAQRLKGSGEQVASSSLNIVAEFFRLRETVVEPAIEDLRAQIDEVVKSTVGFEYLQSPQGSGWSMAGIRYEVVVWTDDSSNNARCEIEFTASEGEDFIRVRAARDGLTTGPAKEVRLYLRQCSPATIQRVFSTFLVECLEGDPDEVAAQKAI